MALILKKIGVMKLLNNISINCHSSIKIITSEGIIIYFDPYNIENKTNDADYIFLTHNHYDHFDQQSINKIKKASTKFVFPLTMEKDFTEIYPNIKNNLLVIPNTTYQIDDLKVKTIPSYNLNKKYHLQTKKWVGYLLTIANETIYVAGDTDNIPELNNINCNIALVPIGGTYTMTYQEAANLINKIKPQVVIPTHYGSVVGNLTDGEEFAKIIDKNIKCVLLIK